MEQRNPPIKDIRVGRVAVAIWRNEFSRDGHAGKFLTASVSKNYKDKDGEWKSTTHFTERELGDLAMAVQQARDYMAIHEHEEWKKTFLGADKAQ